MTMTRRPTGPLLPRGGERPSGGRGLSGGALFRGNLPLVVSGGAAVIIVAVLVFFVAGRCGGKTQDPDCTQKPPAPPSGYAYASNYCAASHNVGQRASIEVPLNAGAGSRGLSIYSYDGGKWTRLAPAQVTQDGTRAVNASAIELPKTFAVLRRSGGDLQVFGGLPRGTSLGADAARVVSYATPQNYTPAADGSVSGGPTSTPQGASFGVVPAIVAEGGPEAQAVNQILVDDAKQRAHVDRIATVADQGGFDGVEVDYTAVDAGLKSNFTAFVQALATRLHSSKRILVLRMPLPRREGSTWNGGAYDWASLARNADYLVMAAERDQSNYRMRVPDAVKYLTGTDPNSAKVDSRKLVLEVSPLSEERSEQGTVRTLTTAEALSIASQITVRDRDKVVTGGDVVVSADNINREGGSGAQWTPQGVVSFSYRSAEDQRTVWIENVFSVGYKLEIAQLYKLGGVAVDNSTADPLITNIWPAIQQFQAAGAPTLAQPNPQTLRPQWLGDDKPLPDVGNRALITWRAPADPGRHTLTVIVSDGTMRVANSTLVDVRAGTPTGGSGTPGATSTPGARFTPPPTRTSTAPTRAPTGTGR
jgi:hypothetical protein